MKLHELREKRASKVEAMRKVVESARLANRDLNADEQKTFDTLDAEARTFATSISREERIAELEREMEAEPLAGEGGEFERERRNFSLLKAIAMQVPDLAPHIDAGREREVSQELTKRAVIKPKGMLVPMDVFKVHRRMLSPAMERRVVSSTLPGGGPGSNVIATELRPEEYIDILRARLVTRRMGARVLSGLVGNLDLPKLESSATAAWVAENSAISPTDQQFDKVTFTPKHVGVLTEYSRNMLLQASPDVEAIVRQDFASLLANKIDAAALKGGGSNEPTGITENANIGDVDLEPVTWARILEFAEDIATANAEMGALGWVTHPKVVRILRSTSKVASAPDSVMLMESPNELAGYPLMATTGMPLTFSSGHSPSESDKGGLIFGNWEELFIGYWSEFDLLVNPFETTAFAKGNVQVRGMATCDVQLRHPESFTAATNIQVVGV